MRNPVLWRLAAWLCGRLPARYGGLRSNRAAAPLPLIRYPMTFRRSAQALCRALGPTVLLASAALAGLSPLARAQADARDFPAAALRLLQAEQAAIDRAVAERDRDQFEVSMARTLAFTEAWGFKSHANPALAAYAACTEAIADLHVAGLCRMLPAAEGCQPSPAPRLADNTNRCRQLAQP